MIESEGRVREQQACIWAANNNRPWPSAWLSPLLHSPPFPADHLLECRLATNHGSRPLGRTHTRSQWDVSLPSLSAATRYSRIACAATVADSLSPWRLCLHLRLSHSQRRRQTA
jgi:hypothetical protein